MFDYEVLRLIWWVLIGVLLIGFAVTDGFDMGVGALLPILGKTDTERRVMINTIAPHWDGNQVWLITAGGALFAAWPMVYATAFSGFYIAMVLTLMALFFRPVGFDYRSKLENPRWRSSWDWCLFIGGLAFRLGGEEFGGIFFCKSETSGFEVCNTIKNEIEALKIEHSKNNASNFITASFGLVFADFAKSNDKIEFETIYVKADEALYEAKDAVMKFEALFFECSIFNASISFLIVLQTSKPDVSLLQKKIPPNSSPPSLNAKPPMNKHQSQLLRQRGFSSLER
jgi:hypothetical protein